MRKWLLRIALTAGLVLVCAGIYNFLRPDRITDENFAKIKADMTEKEVVNILGRSGTEEPLQKNIWCENLGLEKKGSF